MMAKAKTPKGTVTTGDVVKLVEVAFQGSSLTDAAFHRLLILDLIRHAVETLRHHLAKDNVAGVTWKNPRLQLDFDHAAAWIDTDTVEEEDLAAIAKDRLSPDAAGRLADRFIGMLKSEDFLFLSTLQGMTEQVAVWVPPAGDPWLELPPELDDEVAKLPAEEQEQRLAALGAGWQLPPVSFAGTYGTPEGPPEAFAGALLFAVLPMTIIEERDRAFFPVRVGLEFTKGDPTTWSEEDRAGLFSFLTTWVDEQSAPILADFEARHADRPEVPKPHRAVAIRPDTFPVAGGYVRPIYGLSKRPEDLPFLVEYHAPQTPLNWAVGLALFSLTDEDRVRTGDFQEARLTDIIDRVECLTERESPIRGDHRTDILTEVMKLHTVRNWYYAVDTVQVGRAWKKQAVVGSRYAIPDIELVFIDRRTGKRAFPTSVACRSLRVPLDVKGRRVFQPDAKDQGPVWAMPKERWKLEAIRWRWSQSFNDDLLLMPALVESGKRKGLPKRTVTGKPIRKASGLVRVSSNVFRALYHLRAEGRGQLYACRLLVMLAHYLNKTEAGIAADRVFRMLGIPDDYQAKTHRKPEELVAAAVRRLKERDIGALLAGSDEFPRTDPNPDRRKGAYYRFHRAAAFTPQSGLVSKTEAEAIEAEYTEEVPEEAIAGPESKATQAFLPGLVLDTPAPPPIPDGKAIRAAREAAGLTLRNFARAMKGPDFSTWSRYENGRPVRANAIHAEVWKRVRAFVDENWPKGQEEGDK